MNGIRTNPRSRDIISSIIYLSNSLGFTVVAEYVEDETQRAALEDIGCLYYQGYLYSPALPFRGFDKALQGRVASCQRTSVQSRKNCGKREVWIQYMNL